MNSYCKWAQTILGLAMLIVTVRPEIAGATINFWIVAIGSALIVLHPWVCRMCCCCDYCDNEEKMMPKKATKKRR